MKGIIKRAAALAVSAATAAGVIAVSPGLSARAATMQRAVTALNVTYSSAQDGSGADSIDLLWNKPPESMLTDPAAPATGVTEVAYYGVYYRRSNESSYGQKAIDPDLKEADMAAAASGDTRRVTIKQQLEYGTLYGYQIQPYKTYAWVTATMDPRQARSNLDGKNAEALYLKEWNRVNVVSGRPSIDDITLKVSAVGGKVTVEWPKIMFYDIDAKKAVEPFDGYRVYFEKGAAVPAASSTHNDAWVLKSDAKYNVREVNRDGREYYSFSFDDARIEQGEDYTVKVSPIANVSGVPTPMETIANRMITINGKQYNFHRSTEERGFCSNFKVEIELNWKSETETEIRLEWGPGGTGMPAPTSGKRVAKIEVRYCTDGESYNANDPIAVLFFPYTHNISSILTARPNEITYYRLTVYYDDDPAEEKPVYSTVAVYDPDYSKYRPTKPTVLNIDCFDERADKNYPLIDITWEAFYRRAYNKADLDLTNPKGSKDAFFVDPKISYDIYVTDDISQIDRIPTPTASGLLAGNLTRDDRTDPLTNKITPAFVYSVSRYWALVNGNLTEKTIEGNKIYYVKIIAARTDMQPDGTPMVSEPAYGSHFVPPTGPLPLRPVVVGKLPLRIQKDDDGADVVTINTIGVEWDIKWFEAYDVNTGSWYTTIGVDGGKLVFGDGVTDAMKKAGNTIDLNDPEYANEATIRAALKALGADAGETDILPLRLMDLTGAGYELHVVDYEYMLEQGGYEEYMKSVLDGRSKWRTIPPGGDPLHPTYTVDKEDAPGTGNLKPNTAYAILVRPVTADNQAWLPSVVIGTTLYDRPPVDIKPIVPLIIGKSTDATSATVRIEYKPPLQYELMYSEFMADYPAKGELIDNAALEATGEIVTDEGKTWIEYTVQELFPETNYYFWVRAKSATEASEWSNAIMLRTKELGPPKPPQGLGPISGAHLEIINNENNSDLRAIDYNYMIIEWMRDVRDIVMPDPTAPARPGAGAGGQNADQGVNELTSDNIKGFIMAQFSNLKTNKRYYVRAKTILTLVKGKPLQRIYQYTVEVSLNEDFSDSITFTVPETVEIGNSSGGAAAGANQAAPRFLRKESEWTKTVIIYTAPSQGEYDSDKNPAQYPFPDDDFEVTYNPQTDELYFRLRSDKTGADGRADQGVDQRFISRLIENKVFNYVVDLSSYNGKDVTTRLFEMPYSIFRAFDERKISLTIIAGDTKATLPPGWLSTSDMNHLSGFGAGASVKINFSKNVGSTPPLASNESYAVARQKLTITAVTPKGGKTLDYSAKPLTITQTLRSRAAAIDKNVGSYQLLQSEWARQKDSYNRAEGTLTFTTTRPGVYTALLRSVAAEGMSVDTAARDAMLSISGALNFRDITGFNPSANIPANDLDKIIYAVAKGAKEVYVKRALTENERDTLYKGGMLVTGQASVTREEAVAALVRLYEVKTKHAVSPYSSVEQSPYKDISGASDKYRAALLKAGDIGFYGSSGSANPKGALTYGEAMVIIDIIMDDAGMK